MRLRPFRLPKPFNCALKLIELSCSEPRNLLPPAVRRARRKGPLKRLTEPFAPIGSRGEHGCTAAPAACAILTRQAAAPVRSRRGIGREHEDLAGINQARCTRIAAKRR